MISANARPYIDASVPVLREYGVAISTCFYARLFEAHPELKNIFNMANQKNGSQQQALASALFAYAANIDNADALTPVISRIVQKHVSLGIRAEHYPIVGHHLLAAIGEVLGKAATPELIAAWAEKRGSRNTCSTSAWRVSSQAPPKNSVLQCSGPASRKAW